MMAFALFLVDHSKDMEGMNYFPQFIRRTTRGYDD